MKYSNVKYIYFGFISLFLISCSVLQSRLPSGNRDENNVTFNLFNNSALLNKNYSFSLLNLNNLRKSMISFDEYKIKSPITQEVTQNWIQSLDSFYDTLNGDVDFSANKLHVTVKKSEFKKLKQVLGLIAASGEPAEAILRKQVEVISSFNNNFRDPIEDRYEILTIPFKMIAKITPYTVNNSKDNTALKVENSSFWTDRTQTKIDMTRGPSEFDVSSIQNEVCQYAGPKKGYGIHLGFKVECLDKKFKVKFDEVYTATFNSKIYHRLGYNVPAIHYSKSIRVKYDARIFTELFAGKTQYARVTLLGREVHAAPIKRRGDIRMRVAYAVLKDGNKITTDEFFKKLLPSCGDSAMSCAIDLGVLNPRIDQEVDYLVFNNVAMIEDTSDFEFGSWAYDELDHQSRTEVRALALVGAWTGNYDLRKDNNKLQWSSKRNTIRHFISDPGSGFGKEFSSSKWTVIDEVKTEDEEQSIASIQQQMSYYAINFRLNIDHNAFSKLTLQEARWMVRIIAGVSEDELTEVLISSGYSMSEMLLAREKFISLQKNMIEVFKLEDEFPELMARVIDKKMNYQADSEFTTIVLKNGHVYSVDEKNQKIINGVLK